MLWKNLRGGGGALSTDWDGGFVVGLIRGEFETIDGGEVGNVMHGAAGVKASVEEKVSCKSESFSIKSLV